uniref:Transcriptional regulator, HxlR family n=1 Tax=Sphingobacterium sp. (strain 21) TaxID=743722 RepID=F4C4P7_SPHS2
MREDKEATDIILTDDCARKLRAMDDAMYILNGKWKIPILARLCYKPMRYSELLKDIRGISGKMLSTELRELKANGLIKREVLVARPLRVRYALSEYGHTLKQLTDNISDWGLQHRHKIIQSLK